MQYFARVKRRAARSRLVAPHPSRQIAQASPEAEAPLADADLPSEPLPAPVLESSREEPAEPTGRAQPGRSAESSLALCLSFFRAAEQREAPAFFDALTDGGRATALRRITLLPWSSPTLKAQATVFAEALDFCPRNRSGATWSCIVVTLAAIMFEDMCPAFHRVRLKSVEQQNQPFSLVPLRGKYGWKNRARWAGLN